MPGWQPNWNRVDFDHAAAAAAAEECERVAGRLAHWRRQHGGVTSIARQHWRGRYRDEFDPEADRIDTEIGELIRALRALAGRIGDAADDARREQTRREEERDRWRREKRAADERRAQDGQDREAMP